MHDPHESSARSSLPHGHATNTPPFVIAPTKPGSDPSLWRGLLWSGLTLLLGSIALLWMGRISPHSPILKSPLSLVPAVRPAVIGSAIQTVKDTPLPSRPSGTRPRPIAHPRPPRKPVPTRPACDGTDPLCGLGVHSLEP